MPETSSSFGVNVIGYLRAEMGVGESARSSIRSARAVELPISMLNVLPDSPCRNEDHSVALDSSELSYFFNLVHINADVTPHAFATSVNGAARGRYNIGFWAWELDQFPDRWASSFGYYQEIWTPSKFCQKAIARNGSIPVLCMPISVDVSIDRRYSRSDFAIPERPFVFITIFDVLSIVDRKNPIGVIDAFIRAFQGKPGFQLILKINNARSRPRELARLRQRAAGYPITIIDRTLSRQEINGLIAVSDCMVSLHRSEGFGLTLAEAMSLGKPVIATGYSGNLDFTNAENSLLVDYRLTAVGAHNEPYDPNCLWADPDLDQAARHMRDIASNRDLYDRLSREGQSFVRTHLSPAAVGTRIKDRLHAIWSQKKGSQNALVKTAS
jgi:glycosyltransferase involved in cell wall biosynthesis